MKKIIPLLLLVVSITISGCGQKNQNSPIINITSGDIIGINDTVKITGPTAFNQTITNCSSAQDCTDKTITSTGYFKMYSSPDIGISFNLVSYIEDSDSTIGYLHIILVRSGSTAFITSMDYPDQLSQGVYMFEKNPNETTAQAIQRLFITNKDCYIQTGDGMEDNLSYASGYEIYTINHPMSENREKWCSADQEFCYPDTFCGRYALGDYIGFFAGNDSKNKFYFIDGAQDPSLGTNGKERYTTLQFLE